MTSKKKKLKTHSFLRISNDGNFQLVNDKIFLIKRSNTNFIILVCPKFVLKLNLKIGQGKWFYSELLP